MKNITEVQRTDRSILIHLKILTLIGGSTEGTRTETEVLIYLKILSLIRTKEVAGAEASILTRLRIWIMKNIIEVQ